MSSYLTSHCSLNWTNPVPSLPRPRKALGAGVGCPRHWLTPFSASVTPVSKMRPLVHEPWVTVRLPCGPTEGRRLQLQTRRGLRPFLGFPCPDAKGHRGHLSRKQEGRPPKLGKLLRSSNTPPKARGLGSRGRTSRLLQTEPRTHVPYAQRGCPSFTELGAEWS